MSTISKTNLNKNPRSGRNYLKSHLPKGLLICFFDPNGLLTIRENISELQNKSKFEIEVANFWPIGSDYLSLKDNIDYDQYQFIIFHPTATYNPENVLYIDRYLNKKLSQFRGVKILMKQDEQFRSGLLAQVVREKGFDLVLTCLPPTEWHKVYLPNGGHCEFMRTLTGYVSPEMKREFWRDQSGRTIDVGYRGSLQPLAFGRLGLEKREIGDSFLRHVAAEHADLSCDISSRWEDRYSGRNWVAFLQRCKATLGVESGSNLFDFDGEVERKAAAFLEANQDISTWSTEFYHKAHTEFLHEYEGNVQYNQISPRHFEAAAAGTVQILYEGDYSGIFQPWVHYLPLKKDFSNFRQIVEFLGSDEKMSEMARRAFDDIILSDRYTYDSFVRELDERIQKLLVVRGLAAPQRVAHDLAAKPTIYIVASHAPALDPRLGWWARSLQNTFNVVEIGFHRYDALDKSTRAEQIDEGWCRVHLSPDSAGSHWLSLIDSDTAFDTNLGINLIKTLQVMMQLSDPDLIVLTGLFGNSADIGRFRDFLGYFFATNTKLVASLLRLGPPALIIGCDLDTLPACQALSEAWSCELVYDAHEFWPYSLPGFTAGESAFWESVERRLAAHAMLRICVAPQLSALMQESYGIPFSTIPNAVPRADGAIRLGKTATRSHVEFLYQGLFAPGRGLARLIEIWPDTDPRCVLVLRGPEGQYKDELKALADASGLSGSRIIFADAAAESDLIRMASHADVGLIPYEPVNINNKYCCPNKFSQYLAAGLPVLANSTEYLRDLIAESGCGISVDFTDRKSLVQAIDAIAEQRDRRLEQGRAGRAYFERSFNWDVLSADAVARINAIGSTKRVSSQTDFSRADDILRQLNRMNALQTSAGPDDVPAAFNFGRRDDVSAASNFERRIAILKSVRTPRAFLCHAGYFLRHQSRRAGQTLKRWLS